MLHLCNACACVHLHACWMTVRCFKGQGCSCTFRAGSSKQGKASRAPVASNWVVAKVCVMFPTAGCQNIPSEHVCWPETVAL